MLNTKVKRMAVMAAGCLLVAGLLAGCSLYREYRVGAELTQRDGMTVAVDAQLWYVVGSGPLQHIDWLVDWDDGTTSDTENGTPIGAGNFSPSNPLTFMRFTHTYTQTGSYVVLVSCGGSPPAIVDVTVP